MLQKPLLVSYCVFKSVSFIYLAPQNWENLATLKKISVQKVLIFLVAVVCCYFCCCCCSSWFSLVQLGFLFSFFRPGVRSLPLSDWLVTEVEDTSEYGEWDKLRGKKLEILACYASAHLKTCSWKQTPASFPVLNADAVLWLKGTEFTCWMIKYSM